MQVLVIGATGNTGFRLVQRLARSHHSPVAMVRSGAQRARFDELGVPSVLGDLEYPIDHAVRGCDAVVFAAGSGSKTGKDKTVLIDHLGGIRAAVAALEQGVHRFVMLSSINAAPDARTRIAHYHRAKGRADAFLQDMPTVFDGRSLDWTIARAATLHDEARDERVRVDAVPAGKGQVSRDSVAAALAACLDLPHTAGKAFTLYDGQTPVGDALGTL